MTDSVANKFETLIILLASSLDFLYALGMSLVPEDALLQFLCNLGCSWVQEVVL